MQFGNLLVSSLLMLVMACEDPTLLIGARPSGEPEEREAGVRGGGVTVVPEPAADRDARVDIGVGEGSATRGIEPADIDHNVDGHVTRDPSDQDDGRGDDVDGADAGSVSAPVDVPSDPPVVVPDDRPDASALPLRDAGETARGPDGDPWRPPPENRPRVAYRCRGDNECSFFRGVCDHGFCVQCRGRQDCPPYSVCTPDHVCVRPPPPRG